MALKCKSRLVPVLVAGVFVGQHMPASPVTVNEVHAACKAANPLCVGGDGTKTAAVDAAYIIPGQTTVTPVEPTAATSWSITARWSPPPGTGCVDSTQTATVDVSWNGSSWVTSNFIGTSEIDAVGVCDLASCSSHASAYRLYVDINDPHTGNSDNVRAVDFTATTVPNGQDYNSTTCAVGSSRTPTASSFSSTDSGAFECPFNCSQVGTTLNLTYN